MDTIDTTLTRILTVIAESSLSDTEKADLYVQIQVGMRKLVWPIVLTHVPEYLLKQAVDQSEHMTIDQYAELIEASVSNPATPKEIHDEIRDALLEIEELFGKRLTPKAKKTA